MSPSGHWLLPGGSLNSLFSLLALPLEALLDLHQPAVPGSDHGEQSLQPTSVECRAWARNKSMSWSSNRIWVVCYHAIVFQHTLPSCVSFPVTFLERPCTQVPGVLCRRCLLTAARWGCSYFWELHLLRKDVGLRLVMSFFIFPVRHLRYLQNKVELGFSVYFCFSKSAYLKEKVTDQDKISVWP